MPPGTTLSDQELLDELYRLADELGETPTVPQLDEYGKYSSQAYHSHFGSWNAALKTADLRLNQRSGIPTDELLEALRSLAKQLNRAPTTTENSEHGQFSNATYRERFGIWKRANNAAGIPYGSRFSKAKFEAPPEQCQLCNGAKQGSLLFHQWQYGLDVAGCYLCEDCHATIHASARPDKDTKWILSAIENLGQRHREYHRQFDVKTIASRYNIPSEQVVKYVFQAH